MSLAEASLERPTSVVPCRIWRCRLLRSTVSKSTMPMVPTPGRGEIHRHRRAEAAGADAQHLGRLELLLPLHPDFRQDEVAAVALDLLAVERRQGRRRRAAAPAPPATDGMMLSVWPSATGVCSFCR